MHRLPQYRTTARCSDELQLFMNRATPFSSFVLTALFGCCCAVRCGAVQRRRSLASLAVRGGGHEADLRRGRCRRSEAVVV